MRNLWLLMLVSGACVDEDVASVEQRLSETYDVCSKDACTKCWIDAADKHREICDKPVDVTAHRGIAKTDLVFESTTHEVALWSVKAGWRVLSPTYVTGDAFAAGDFDGDGSLELPVGVGGYWNVARDPASGQATGKRGHGPVRSDGGATRRNSYWRMMGMELNGDGATDMLWSGEQGELEIGFIERDETELVDPARALPGWTLLGGGAFFGTKTMDLVWRKGGALRIRSMAGSKITAEREASVDATWAFVGATDLDKDRRADLIWRDASGLIVWPSGAPEKAFKQTLDPKLRIEALHDLDGDGVADLLARDDAAERSTVYVLRGTAWEKTSHSVGFVDNWRVQR